MDLGSPVHRFLGHCYYLLPSPSQQLGTLQLWDSESKLEVFDLETKLSVGVGHRVLSHDRSLRWTAVNWSRWLLPVRALERGGGVGFGIVGWRQVVAAVPSMVSAAEQGLGGRGGRGHLLTLLTTNQVVIILPFNRI